MATDVKKERARTNNWGRQQHDDCRDIGKTPAIVDPLRRDACKKDLRKFLLTYFPDVFALEFSDDHELMIQTLQDVILNGGQFATAMPRGSGKTSIMQHAVVFAVVYRHRRYPMLICADDAKFKNLLLGIKTVFETSELLNEDFPEICHPVRALERSATRSLYQMQEGKPTYIKWSTDKIQFPTTKATLALGTAGSTIGGGGLTGSAIRGTVSMTASGEQLRPDAILCDDPQTRASASSPTQCQTREDTIKGDLLGMAGPGKTMALMIAMTVIYRDDLAERLLDVDRSPQIKGMRVSMIKSWPKSMNLWEDYHEKRRQEMVGELPAGTAGQYYLDNRDRMDDGGQVYWESRIDPGFNSALESAMAEYFEDPRSFMAEKQNTPEEDLSGDLVPLNPITLAKRVSGHERHRVPANCDVLTCHVDVQLKMLYYMVCGWTKKFGGYVIDYGRLPEQRLRHFSYKAVADRKKKKTGKILQDVYSDQDEEGSIRQGLVDLLRQLTERKFIRADGAEMQLDLTMVDQRYKPDVVEEAIQVIGSPLVIPAWGFGIGAKDMPLKLRRYERGTFGKYWVYQLPRDRQLRSAFVDTNFWKSEAYNALAVPPGHSHAVLLYKQSQSHHQLVADHFCSEYATTVEARGRKIHEWDLPASKPDNHHWDNLVGCMVAASIKGVTKEHETNVQPTEQPVRRKRRVRF